MFRRFHPIFFFLLLSCPSTALGLGPAFHLEGMDGYFVTLREVDDAIARGAPHARWPLAVRYSLAQIRTRVDYEGQRLSFLDSAEGLGIRLPAVVSYDDYFKARETAQFHRLWGRYLKQHIDTVRRSQDPGDLLSISMPVQLPSLFGGGVPVFSVTGSQRIEISGRSEWREGDIRTATNNTSRFPNIRVKQQQRFTVSGKIGEKVNVTIAQDSEAFSALDNSISLRYEDVEEDGSEGNGIIKRFEAGNVSLSLDNAEFTGYTDQHSGLFGLKLETQLGGVTFTTVVSQEKADGQSSSFQAGTQGSRQQIRDVDFRRWTYFFIDPSYRENFSRRDANGIHLAAVDSIETIRVFVSDRASSFRDLANLRKATAFFQPPIRVDGGLPSAPDTTTEDPELADFRELQSSEFFVDRNLGYLVLETPLQLSDVLAVYYVTRNRLNGRQKEYGNVPEINNEDNKAALRLLKTRKENPPTPDELSDPRRWGAWQYEWRNVYFLGKTEINPQGFDLKIFKIAGGSADQDIEEESQTPFIQLLGLDRRGIEPGSGPDRLVDIDYELINFQRGELILPDLYPFAPNLLMRENGLAFPATQQNGLADQTPQLYTVRTTDIQTNISNFNKYYMVVEYKDRQAQFSLGRSNIIEGSEVVRLNGRKLVPGKDYILLYEVGQIKFLSEEALDPNADVKVDFQYAPFFKPASSTLMAFQSRYNINDRSWIRGTLLRRSDKTLDQKSRIGRETGRDLLWDVDSRLMFKPRMMTSIANALPFVETQKPSSLNISAELAQSIPNPNTRGDAFIDDFEGSKQEQDLGVRRAGWVPSSPPEGRAHRQRGNLVWYNPVEQVSVREIFPTREVIAQDSRQHVLTMEFDPATPDLRWGGAVDSDFLAEWSRDSPDALRTRWGGLMHPLIGAGIDQTRSRFIEIWVNGNRGQLHIDLGSISEDVNGNTLYDTEDDRSDGGFGNNLLDPGEDIGLDGQTDSEEVGYDPVTRTVVPFDPVGNPDPHGDNFFFDAAPVLSRNFADIDFSRINGTEGNVNDPDKGRRPDTEDINNSGFLDTKNDYFSYAIDLAPGRADTALVAGGDLNSANWGKRTSWRMYRIPLETTAVNTAFKGQTGNPSFALIEMVRIWMTGVETPATLRIASIQIVGNQWLADPRSSITDTLGTVIPPEEVTARQEAFNVSVKNTYDNPGDYIPPPGAVIETDRVTGVENREQSLAFGYKNLQPGHNAGALRTFITDQDYTLYNDLRLFLYGSASAIGDQAPEFFIRFGTSANDYYEYRTRVVPGWDPQNEIRIIFDDLTLLKGDTQAIRRNAAQEDTTLTLELTGGKAYPVVIKDGTAPNRKIAIAFLDDGRQYRVQGTPSLSRIRQYIAGVANPYDHPLDQGEVWIDELRTGNVRRDKGLAGRLSVDAAFADFMTLRTTFREVGSNYRFIGQPEVGSTTRNIDINTAVSVHKFFPKEWGLSIPLRIAWQRNRQLPRLLVGSDIVLVRDRDRREQRTESNRFQLSTSFSKRGRSKNLLAAWTIDRWRINFASSLNRSRSVTREDTTSTYNFSMTYDLTPRKQHSLSPFKWAEGSIVPKWLSGMKFKYLPTQVSTDLRVDRAKQTGINRQFTNNRTNRFTRNLFRAVRGKMNPVKPLTLNYQLAVTNDIRADSTISFKRLHFGREVDYNQTFGMDFRPVIATWLRPSYSFTTGYRENRNPQLQIIGTSSDDRTINQNNRRTFRANVDVDRMLDSAFGRPGKKPGKKKKEKKDEPEHGPGFGAALWHGFRRFSGILTPVNITHSQDQTQSLFGLRSRPSLLYRFGFRRSPGVTAPPPDSAGGITIQRDRVTTARTISVDTGLKPVPGVTVGFRPNWRKSTTRSLNTNIETRSRTWPDWSARWTPSLRGMPSVNRVIRRLNFNTGYSRKVDESKNNNLASIGSLNLRPESRTVTTTLNPLVGINTVLITDLSVNGKYDATNIKTRSGLSSTDQSQRNRTLTISLNYRLRPGVRIGGKKLQGNMNIQTQLIRSSTLTLLSRDGKKFTPSNGQKQLSIRVRSDYQFSRHVRGGVTVEWTNTENSVTQEKRRIRQGGFWTEFLFN